MGRSRNGGLAAFALAVALAAGSGCAMNARADGGDVACRVIDGGKLAPSSGGPDALCAAIEQAVSARAADAGASVEVRVLSPFALSATVVLADGRAIPEQKFASNDRALTASSFRRFADALATAIADAASR